MQAEHKNLETSEVLYKRALILIHILVREAELSPEGSVSWVLVCCLIPPGVVHSRPTMHNPGPGRAA